MRLKGEANAILLRLGHAKMTDWLHLDGVWKARCLTCSAGVVLNPRSYVRAPIVGEAIAFECRRR